MDIQTCVTASDLFINIDSGPGASCDFRADRGEYLGRYFII